VKGLREAYRLRVVYDRVLKRTFGPNRGDKIGAQSKLHNQGIIRNLYSSLYIIRKIKSRRIRWAGHGVTTGRRRMHIGF
jgi:hypothetical protein